MNKSDNNNITPVISVIIPTRNRADKLKQAIESVLNQSYRNFELLIVDDSSNDNTTEIANSFKDSRISFLQHHAAMGASAARNTALRTCKGEYVAFLDDDDEWLTTKLEKQMKVFSKAPPEVGIVYTAYWKIEKHHKSYMPTKDIIKKEGHVHDDLLEGNFIALPSVIIRKKYLDSVGLFSEQMPRLQDWDLFIRLSKKYQFIFIDEPLLINYCSKDSISSNDAALAEAMELILKKNFDDIKKNMKLLLKYYIIIGNLFVSIKKMKKARRYFANAIKKQPWNIKFLSAFLTTVLGQNTYFLILKIFQKVKALA